MIRQFMDGEKSVDTLLERIQTWFHGTSEENAQDILEQGIRIIRGEGRQDPGDLGTGFYVAPNTDILSSSQAILEVEFDDSNFAKFKAFDILFELNQEFDRVPVDQLPFDRYSESAELFLSLNLQLNEQSGSYLFKTATIGQEDRFEIGERIREQFLNRGWDGIISRNTDTFAETVIFDPDVITNVSRVR